MVRFGALVVWVALFGAGCGGGGERSDAPQALEVDGEATPLVVFVTGDEEYRSEESMPMLAGLVERELRARTAVCYALDETGAIDPNRRDHIAGLELLEVADLMVLFTRFRSLPEEELAWIDGYVEAGKPVVGFRTATHAFAYEAEDPRAAVYNEVWPERVFGAGWVTHHGHFDDGEEPLTRVELAPGAAGSAVLRGVEAFDAYSWVYHVQGGGDTLPEYSNELLFGEALRSNHAGNEERFPPVQPVAWTRNLRTDGGLARVFFTTLGHPYDFRDANMRRLALGGIAWALGEDGAIPEGGFDVGVERYEPSNSGFGEEYRPHVYPLLSKRGGADEVRIEEGEVIAVVGGGFADRLRFHPRVEATLRVALGGAPIDLRNLGWNGDTVTRREWRGRTVVSGGPGDGLTRPKGVPFRDDWLAEIEADTLLACFGMVESFAGEAGLATFRQDLGAWLDSYEQRSFNGGESLLQVGLVGPTPHEDLGPPLPDGIEHDAALDRYSAAMAEVAAERDLLFIDLHRPLRAAIDAGSGPLSLDGVQLNDVGYALAAAELALGLGLPRPKAEAVDAALDELGPLIETKDRLWFGRFRTLNSEYVHGERYEPFGPDDFPQRFEALANELRVADDAIDAAARLGGQQ